MKKLEFDQKIFEIAWGEGIGVVGVIRRYLELAQEPPKPVTDFYITIDSERQRQSIQFHRCEEDAISIAERGFRKIFHLLYNHDTGKIEDITEDENDK